jgi:hypothetical protein
MEATEAIRRVLDGEPSAQVKDGNGHVIFTYFRKGKAIYVMDKEGERPIMFFPTWGQAQGH